MNRQELTVLAAADDSSRHRQVSRLLKPGRNVATLAGAQILCFLVLAQLEPRFFIIHLYQLIPYVAILSSSVMAKRAGPTCSDRSSPLSGCAWRSWQVF